jgi:hypothetical protein
MVSNDAQHHNCYYIYKIYIIIYLIPTIYIIDDYQKLWHKKKSTTSS